MQNKNQQGSFGIPEDMLRAIEEMEQKKHSVRSEPKAVRSDEELVEEVVPPKKKVETEKGFNELTEGEKKKKLKEIIVEIRKDLGVEITEDDIWSFLYNNEIIKRGITIIPDKMYATFRTLSLDDTNDIDNKMASALEEKRLENGFKNINTQWILSRGLLELGRTGALKSLGETAEERFQVLGKMSALLVEKISRKWNEFVFLVDEAIKEEMALKKD